MSKTDLEQIREWINDGYMQCACLVTACDCNDDGDSQFVRDGRRVVTTDFPRALAALELCLGELDKAFWIAGGHRDILAILNGEQEEPDVLDATLTEHAIEHIEWPDFHGKLDEYLTKEPGDGEG